MERLDMYVKTIAMVVGGLISYMVGGLGLAFTVLLGLMVIDYATGLMVAIYKKNLSSRVGSRGFIRKLYVILLIGAVYLIEQVTFEQVGYIADGVAVAYCVMELVSIVENGGKLNVPLPKMLKDLILVLKPKSEQK